MSKDLKNVASVIVDSFIESKGDTDIQLDFFVRENERGIIERDDIIPIHLYRSPEARKILTSFYREHHPDTSYRTDEDIMTRIFSELEPVLDRWTENNNKSRE